MERMARTTCIRIQSVISSLRMITGSLSYNHGRKHAGSRRELRLRCDRWQDTALPPRIEPNASGALDALYWKVIVSEAEIRILVRTREDA